MDPKPSDLQDFSSAEIGEPYIAAEFDASQFDSLKKFTIGKEHQRKLWPITFSMSYLCCQIFRFIHCFIFKSFLHDCNFLIMWWTIILGSPLMPKLSFLQWKILKIPLTFLLIVSYLLMLFRSVIFIYIYIYNMSWLNKAEGSFLNDT